MTEDDAARGLPTCPATYLLRDGIPVCSTCGAVIGRADADQIRHSTWHTTLAALFAVADPHDPSTKAGRRSGPPRPTGKQSPVEQD
jgi:hypothetical protein